MATLFVDKIDPQSGTSLTIGSSGDTVALTSGVKQSNMMYPAFEAYLSSDQTVSSGVQTKIQFDTEDLDTDSAYDNSTNYRFTPQVAGKYYVYGSVRCNSSGSDRVQLATVFIYKNGSEYKESGFDVRESSGGDVNNLSPAVSAIVDMNGSSDYVELFGRNLNSTLFKGDTDRKSYFGAYRIGS